MDTVLLVVFFVIYGIFLFLYSSFLTRKNSSASEFISGGRHMQAYTAAVSSFGTDLGFWVFAIIPAVAMSAETGTSHAISLVIATATVLFFIWELYAKRLRLYSEILGQPLTVAEFCHKRLKTKGSFTQVFFGSVSTLFSLLCGVAALCFSSAFLSKLFGWDILFCFILCTVVVFFYTLASGSSSVFDIGLFQGILLFLAFVLFTVFAYLKLSTTPGLLSELVKDALQNPFAIQSAKPMGFWDTVSFFAYGLCLLGTPSLFLKFMTQKNRRPSHRTSIFSVVLMVLGGLCAILISLFASIFCETESGLTVLVDAAATLEIPFLQAFFCSSVLLCLLGATATHLSTAFLSLSNDIIPNLSRKKEPLGVGEIRIASIFTTAIACLAAIFAKDYAMEIFLFASSCMACVFGPVLLAMLYRKHLSPVSACLAAAIGILTTVLFTLLLPKEIVFADILPGLAATTLALVIGGSFKHKTSSAVLSEFERMERLVHTKGNDLYNRDKSLNEDTINW